MSGGWRGITGSFRFVWRDDDGLFWLSSSYGDCGLSKFGKRGMRKQEKGNDEPLLFRLWRV
jgi:hypothetical protein